MPSLKDKSISLSLRLHWQVSLVLLSLLSVPPPPPPAGAAGWPRFPRPDGYGCPCRKHSRGAGGAHQGIAGMPSEIWPEQGNGRGSFEGRIMSLGGSNGDTQKGTAGKSRHLLFKDDGWTQSQKERAEIILLLQQLTGEGPWKLSHSLHGYFLPGTQSRMLPDGHGQMVQTKWRGSRIPFHSTSLVATFYEHYDDILNFYKQRVVQMPWQSLSMLKSNSSSELTS